MEICLASDSDRFWAHEQRFVRYDFARTLCQIMLPCEYIFHPAGTVSKLHRSTTRCVPKDKAHDLIVGCELP